jgi:hypothetical protein
LEVKEASSEDEMEKRLEKEQLCWNANRMGVSSNGLEWEDAGQGIVSSGKTGKIELTLKAVVGLVKKAYRGPW